MRTFALILGLQFLLAGIAGFVPGLLSPPPEGVDLTIHAGHGLLFGLLPVNVLHNLVHVLFGIWGLVAARGWGASRAYSATTAVIYAALTVMGLIPALSTTFGLVPLYGGDVAYHGVIAVLAAYFGFVARAPETARTGDASPGMAAPGVRTYDKRP